MSDTTIMDGTIILTTRIPEGRVVEGLIYGAHVSRSSQGRSGYYVTTPLAPRWGVAWLTPERDVVSQEDEDIVDDIAGELGEVTDEQVRGLRDEAATAGDIVQLAMCDAATGTLAEDYSGGGLRAEDWRRIRDMARDEARAACAAALRR